MDQVAHCFLLIRHDAFPLCFHFVEHLSRLLHAIGQLLLLFGFAGLHGAHHGLFGSNVSDFCIYLL